MNLLDYCLAGTLIVSTAAAAMQGLFYEIWMFSASLAAIGIAAWQYDALAPFFSWAGSEAAANAAAFIAVMVLVLLAAMVVGRMLRGVLRGVGMGGLDRFLGALLGLVRGWALGVAAIFILIAYPVNPQWVRGSTLAPGYLWASRSLAAIMPDDLAARFQRQWHNLLPDALHGISKVVP